MIKSAKILLRGVLIIVLFLSIIACPPLVRKLSANQEKTKKTLKINEKNLTVEVADTFEKKLTGLMFRKELGKDEGMLFCFDKPQKPVFWMKNTYLPLSLAFIDANGIILQLEDLKPEDLTPVAAKEKVLYALEVNKGWFEQNKIKTGDVIKGLAD